MAVDYITDKTFEKEDYTVQPLSKAEYEDCHFVNCNFSGTNVSGCIFVSCNFTGCNLSLAKLTQTAFRDVVFKDCKMMGLQFGDCNEFALSFIFEHCLLDHSSFYKLKLKKQIFQNCKLTEADFTEADLSQSVFDECDLSGAMFDRTILEKADMRTAYNYALNPETNRIKKAKFSLNGLPGLLNKYDIVVIS